MAEEKRYLDYDGLSHLVEKLNNKIEASGSGSGGSSGGHTGACDGVYVAYVDYNGVKRICPASEWSDGLGAAQGVMVGDGTHEVLLAPTHASSTKVWKYTYGLTGGIITTTSSSSAQNDFNGRLNTEGIAAQGDNYLSENYAVGWCRAYAYGATPAGDWWLPSAGELYLIYLNKDDVATALGKIENSNALGAELHCSSTQADYDYAWAVDLGNGDTYSVGYNCRVRAVAAFDYVA